MMLSGRLACRLMTAVGRAFATTEAVNDRLCIERGLKVLLSPTDTAACCTGYQCGFSQASSQAAHAPIDR